MSAPTVRRRPSKIGRLSLRNALALYLIRFRRRWVQEVLAILGIAVGVALLYASQVASTSMSGPVRSLNEGIVGNSQLQLIGRGGTGFPEQVYDDVMAVPGVVRAAPVLQVPGNAVGPHGARDVTFYGADPRIVKLRGNLLQGFGANDAATQETVVLTSPMAHAIGVHTGDDTRFEIAGRTVTVPVLVAAREQVGALVNTSIALVPLAYLQRLAGSRGQVSRILIEAKPGAVEPVKARLTRLARDHAYDVRPAMWETQLYETATSSWKQSSAIFSALSALVGWLFAVCALMVTAADRRALADEQHDHGFPPSATLKALFVDAGVIGIAGVVLGLAAGEALSRRGFGTDVTFLSGAFPVGDQRVVSWQTVVLAAVGGLLAAVVGVLGPARDVVRRALPGRWAAERPRATSPAGEQLSWSKPSTTAAGVISFVGAVAITVAAPRLAAVGLLFLGVAVILLLPLVLGGAVATVARLNERTRSFVPCVLAVQQLRSSQWRTRAIAIAATGAVAVFGATSLQGARANLQAGLDGVSHGLDDVADVWVSPTGAGHVFGTAAFAPTGTQALRATDAVHGVTLYRAGLLDIANTRAWVIGQPRTIRQLVPPGNVIQGSLRASSDRIRSGGWATVSQNIATALHLHLGESFWLPSPAPIKVRLAAITTNFGWPGGSVILNADDFAAAWRSGSVAAYHVQLAPGVTSAAGRAEVARAIGTTALHVETAQQRVDKQSAASRGGLSRLRQIAQLTLLAAVLAMAAAMTGLLWQHRAVVIDLKLNGLGTGLLWRALLVETAVLFGAGTLTGAAFGLIGQPLCTRGVQVVTGFPVVNTLRVDIVAETAGIVIGASLLAVAISGYLVARVRPDWGE